MITVLTGTPGSGKTSLLLEILMEECKKGRKIYCDNVPELVLRCEKAGRIDKWQEGNWLGIDSYDPLSPDDPDFDPDSCWKPNGNERPDAGALIVVDEAQRWFRPRNSSKGVPDHVAALEVHRHQGLDFLFITQRTRLLDSNVTGLCSKHIHIKVTPFGRKKYEWAEIGNPDSRDQRSTAAVSRYKPNPQVFGLYKSASLHTKLKHKLPNVFWLFLIACTVGVSLMYFAGKGIYSRMFPEVSVASASVPDRKDVPDQVGSDATPEPRATPDPARPSSSVPDLAAVLPISGCIGYHTETKGFRCQCHSSDGYRVPATLAVCLENLDLDSVPEYQPARQSAYQVSSATDRFNRFREREWARLHPYKPMPDSERVD